MEPAVRQTRSHLMQLFERHGYHPRFKLGQNFLIDINIIEFVVRSGELTSNDVVLEVGAGTAGMTTFLAEQAGHVVSVEIDRNMFQLASEAIAPYSNVTLLNVDALKGKNHLNPAVLEEVERQLAVSPERRLKLVANLPYSVATPVIANLIATELPWTRMVVTIQYELGLRMQALPASEDYGALSVWLQSQCQVEILKKVGPTVFWPRPKVDSAIVQLLPDETASAHILNRPFFHDYIRRVFNYRRKLLRGVICGMYRDQLEKSQIDSLLAELGLLETVRAEELDVAQHIQLGNRLFQMLQHVSLDDAAADELTLE
ncbi:16S rRNA (adenine(1518)-N(6)/adenine(1519)-N(6))-dimethyltransferase RsmA [Planctomicrobium piriforme]|uniref:Ribosomal RNA small subunit methyltransferase A n=1 Tax=Planctomicrobium piriforme TaxID=1576369 RepID=A0A1I3R1J9_9PLAN|nr:16S rRNA (adenine(1518)-N(6)/adenine(1519)-N(6))-dimethyltransferase RsmA [Planctomicrobium piriforme]SFJ39126.1 16S rRNA (adenine1518-N6/adenine1519-N6)-dimethyltransferase [Planctomicrobium piriforme]